MGRKILMIATEYAPMAKTGGLGDVLHGLSKALVNSGHTVTVVLPLFKSIRQSGLELRSFSETFTLAMDGETVTGRFVEIKSKDKVKLIGVENDLLYNREDFYVDPDTSMDYKDNALRFGFFGKAALHYCRHDKFRPHIIHGHDWQAGLAMADLALNRDSYLEKCVSLFTIHNMAYQGLFDKELAPFFGLSEKALTENGVLHGDRISLLKAGIVYSDAVTTVSEKYAEEIKTAQYGFGMQEVLNARSDKLTGIINGVDYSQWNPETDQFLVTNYSAKDMSGKQVCKRDMLSRFSLPEHRENFPIFAIVSRLIEQKGLDLVLSIAPDLVAHNASLLVLGKGDKSIEQGFLQLAEDNPRRIGVKIGYDEKLAHIIEAGADFFLMPSRFEPCGLNQMYSLRYGTIPIVRAVGGLDDTVKEFWPKTGRGNGFKFHDPDPEQLLKSVAKALDIYSDEKWFAQIRDNAMSSDYSWERQSRKYVVLYNATMKRSKSNSEDEL